MMKFQRARSDKNKEERINNIVDAGSEIYDKEKLNGLTFDAIAKKLNATRPLIYNYFSTKEEIAGEILRKDLTSWSNDMKRTFSVKEKYSIDEISKQWTECLIRHKRMIELYSIQTILANNMSSERIMKLKESIKTSQETLTDVIGKLIPEFDEEKKSYFYNMQMSLAIGLYPMYNAASDDESLDQYSNNYHKSIKMILSHLKN